MANDTTQHPYGAGSHAPLADVREMPACYPIKGNVDSMLYHRPDSQNYGATIAEVWFDSPSAAEAAGFALAPRHSKDGVSADYEPGGSGHPCSAATVNASRNAIASGAGVAAAGLAPLGGGVSDVHPYGAGSHAPLADVREMPACYPIKGNVDSMLYHRPDSQNYGATIAEVWFDSPSAAEAAGFALAPRHSKDGVSADYEPGGSGHPCAVAAVNANRSAVIGGAAFATGGSTTVDGDSSGGLGAGAVAAGAAGVAAVAGLAGLSGRDDDTVDVSELVAGADGTTLVDDRDGSSSGVAGVAAAGGAVVGGLAGLDAQDDVQDDAAGAAGVVDAETDGATDEERSGTGAALLGGAAALGGVAAAGASRGGDVAGDVAAGLGSAASGAVDGAGDLAAGLGSAASGAVDGAGDAAAAVGSAASGAVGGAKDMAGGALGKAAGVAGAGGAGAAGMLRGDDEDDDGAGLAGCLRKWWWLLLLLLGLLLLALLLSQCGGDDDDADVVAPDTTIAVDEDLDTDVESNGLDADGFDADGFDVNGFDVDGFDVNGFDVDGFDVNGFDVDGFDADGFDADGFDVNGFNADGFDVNGFDVNGFDVNGFDVDGFNADGVNADGEGAEAELQTLAGVAEGASPQVLGLLGPLGLSAALEGDGPFTLFLPSDDGAIAALGANPDLLNSVSADPELATSVLGYHIVPGLVSGEDIAAGGTFVTSTGLELTVADGAVNGISLTPVPLEGTNGLIYVIDGVLLPPESPQLAVTGASSEALVTMGLVLVLLGGGFLVVSRRRQDELV